MKCKACGKELTSGNSADLLCGSNTRGMSCTMKAFLFGEDLGLARRPVEKSFWLSPEWSVIVDQWLETQPPPR